MKSIFILMSLVVSSCALMSDMFPTDLSGGVTETKDVITDEVKITSTKIDDQFENRKPIISANESRLEVFNAIRLKPYIVKHKNEMTYVLKLIVINQRGPVTSELMFKCMGQDFLSHKLPALEREAINTFDQTFVVNKKSSLYYQEELIETKITPTLFNYLADCSADIVMRAKNIKSSVDSSLPISDPAWMKLHDGMETLRSKVQTTGPSP